MKAFPPTHTRLADIQDTLLLLRSCLAPRSDTPGLDAQTLLAHILDRSRSWLLTHPDALLTREQDQAVSEAMERIRKVEALPYVIGRWEFFGLDFKLTREVLIPRPETELLVETALTWLKEHPGRRWAADVGTGSCCIAISLAVNTADLKVLATDISSSALRVAAQNAAHHAVSTRVFCLQSDLLQPFGRRFDLICANLPYIPTSSLERLEVFQKEPGLALDGGSTGLTQISRLLKGAPGWITPGGLLLAELESSQGAAASRLAHELFPEAEIRILPDLAGHDRLLSIQMPN